MSIINAIAMLLALSSGLICESQQDDTILAPGSLSPAWHVTEWISGEPIEWLNPKGTYVIEFWATWCGPCVEKFPHLSEIASRHPEATIVALSIDSNPKEASQFVNGLKQPVTFRVGHVGDQGGMVESWLRAADQDAIPVTFIVHQGQLVWIGRVRNLDQTLNELKNATFDLAAAKQAFASTMSDRKIHKEINMSIEAILRLREAGKKAEAESALAELVKNHSETSKQADFMRYEWMAEDSPADWLQKTQALIADGQADSRQQVCSFALRAAKKPGGAELARTAIKLSLADAGMSDWNVLIYARLIYTELGDQRELLQITQQMLELFSQSPAKDNAGLQAELLETKRDLEQKIGR